MCVVWLVCVCVCIASVLQSIAVHCSVLQRVVVCRSVLQCVLQLLTGRRRCVRYVSCVCVCVCCKCGAV